MKKYLAGVYYSLPIQLLLLHFRKYQVLLLFWYILFAVVNGSFMERFGVNNLYMSPEYLDHVNALSTAMVGISFAVFFMSWNVTTFILHSKHLQFLATTSQPFLKYCINNAILPVVFLIFYAVKTVSFQYSQELFEVWELVFLVAGFLCGFILAVAIAFGYFFGADKTIFRLMSAAVKDELIRHKTKYENGDHKSRKHYLRIDWYLSATFKLRKPRDVQHYTQDFIDRIFKQHHIAAIISIFIAFASLITVGFFLDNKFFQLPAAASITVFFAILIAVAGAFSYFLQAWALPFLLLLFMLLNVLYEHDVIDPRNKVYGLNYDNLSERPRYDQQALWQLSSAENMRTDSLHFIDILNRWKQRQGNALPVMYIISTSGGGTRSSTFTMDVLQRIDSLTNGGLMPQTALITGASGGMMGATYFRELYAEKLAGKNIVMTDEKYVDDIAADLMNPLFSSFVARDLIAPAQHFKMGNHRYVKDRGYSFEQKLNSNTRGLLDKQLKDYVVAENNATIPLAFFNSVITRDGRRMTISTQPARFMMRQMFDTAALGAVDPDGVDFVSYFAKQEPYNIRLLTALRMNATFPYVLPNVWLPTDPVVDVMDAGFRDNTGLETAMRFMFVFRNWIKANCKSVVLVQIRDKKQGGWDNILDSKNIADLLTKPALLTQHNLFRFQEYSQHEELDYIQNILGAHFQRVVFEYEPFNKNAAATLSFHLTQREKKDIKASLDDIENNSSFWKIEMLQREK
ncbi:MAG: patatin-like phospholipase family protein [Chitinophagaceae bacterium]